MRRLSLRQSPAVLAGGALLYRAAVGYCPAYGALGLSTAKPWRAGRKHWLSTGAVGELPVAPVAPIAIEQSITIGRPASELSELWLDPQIVSQSMAGLAEVRQTDGGEFEWSLQLPLRQSVSCVTGVTEQREGQLIRWESAPEGTLGLSGALELKAAPLDWGTEVTLRLELQPPGAAVGRALAKALGPVPKLLVLKALRQFKSLAEAGEIPTLHSNPAARHDGRDNDR